MENDLISRSALKKYFNDHSTHWLNEWDTAGVLLAIENAPAVDAESLRPKGRWVTDEKGVTYCEKCRHIDDYASVHNYCPNCGARMINNEGGIDK